MYTKESPIGVFDSGVGGISVLRELVKQMPREDFLYYGDSANAPYGGKTTAQVQTLAMNAAKLLLSRGCKALVVACNTATAAAIGLMRRTYPDTIIVGIEPALKVAADRFPRGHIGIMATQVTLREEKLSHQVQCFPQVQVERIAAPGLVELVEQGKAESREMEDLLRPILAPYAGKLDALVLGCTHYPFAEKVIRRILGDMPLLDGSEGTARQTRHCLESQGLLNPAGGRVYLENSLRNPEIMALSRTLLGINK